MSNQQFEMRATLDLLKSVASGKKILNEGRVGQLADDLESLSDAEFQKEYGKTKAEMRKGFSGGEKKAVKEMDYGGGKNPYAGHGLSRDDDDGKKELKAKPTTSKKVTKSASDTLGKEFSKAYDKKDSVKEGISNADQDPNLAKAYRMGYEAYKAYRNDPELAQAAQDKIEAEFPQYAEMWLRGYRDGETLPRGVAEGSDDNYHHDAETLAEGALNAAARYIQDELGIETGDAAGMFFTGKNLEMIMDVLTEYAEYELQHQRDSDTENVDPSLEENFGGGMRDRPGPEHKSFDLAENKRQR